MKLKITIGKLVIEIEDDDIKEPRISIEREDDDEDDDEIPSVTPTLSHREASILAKVAKGLSNKEIANILVLTESTVKVHMKSILKKLRMKNRTQAAIWVQNGGSHHEEAR